MNKQQKMGRILVVDDDKDVLHAAQLFLKQHVYSVQTLSLIHI